METLVECCRCYFVERKILSGVAGAGLGLVIFFALGDNAAPAVRVVAALAVFMISSNIMYVVSTESYFNCQCESAVHPR